MISREFNSLEEIEEYYDKRSNTYIFKEDEDWIDLITFNFDLNVKANIEACNIKARNIKVYNIDAWNINAYYIIANNIKAKDINALDIDSYNIDSCNIKARNIDALDIKAFNIIANNYTDFIKDRKSKRKDKDNIFCTGITDKIFIHFAIKYLLGKDWYVVDPLGHQQINQIALEEILYKYSKEYRKEIKEELENE